MKKIHFFILLSLFGPCIAALSQSIDSARFFSDETPFEMTLTSDLKTLMSKRMQKAYQPATVSMTFADGTNIKEEIRIQTRGKFRLETCYMPPIMLNFKNPTSPKLRVLKKLKLVCGCQTTGDDEQLIIKEYLAYKMYNLITEKSFRVRLVKIKYEDTRGKVKPYTQYGFLLEDVDEVAARNKCVEVEGGQFLTESTDRRQMTLVYLFEYMIGNTDWSVPHYHNVKLMRSVNEKSTTPYTVPYDFNNSGLVNASYALPQEELGIESVRVRLYRGFPRTMEELEAAIAIFKKQQDKIESLISNCEWLSSKYKKEMNNYLADFFKIIDSKSSVKHNFIDNARTQ
ncbi:MAG TPA: hypothetical protein VFZ42_02835 [Chitinophagaceae bacterium]